MSGPKIVRRSLSSGACDPPVVNGVEGKVLS